MFVDYHNASTKIAMTTSKFQRIVVHQPSQIKCMIQHNMPWNKPSLVTFFHSLLHINTPNGEGAYTQLGPITRAWLVGFYLSLLSAPNQYFVHSHSILIYPLDSQILKNNSWIRSIVFLVQFLWARTKVYWRDTYWGKFKWGSHGDHIE